MARYYTALGPFESREIAERARASMTESDALRANVLRLRDRTGPSVAARLATAEERLDAMEGHLRDMQTRIGDLEDGDPAPVRPEPGSVAWQRVKATQAIDDGERTAEPEPTPEQIEAYLSTSQWWIRDASADNIGAPGPAWRRRGLSALCYPYGPDPLEDLRCGEVVSDWEMRRRLSVANKASTTAPDPDRLAKVAYVASLRAQGMTETLPWSPAERAVCRGIAAAVAEANGLENDVLAKGLDDISAERDALQAELAALRANRLAKVGAEPTDDDLLDLFERSEYASGDTRAARRALYNLGREHGRAERDALLARAGKAERELAKWVQEASDVGAALKPYRAPLTAAFVSRADDIRGLVADWQKRGEELEALRKELSIVRWQNEGLRIGEARSTPEETATRDPLTDPREGDWFVDADSQVREVLGLEGHGVAFTINGGSTTTMSVANFVRNRRDWGARAMTPAEVEAFKANGTRPAAMSEAEMAAELREAGWRHTERWGWVAPGDGNTTIWTTATAHAAMRAAKGAR